MLSTRQLFTLALLVGSLFSVTDVNAQNVYGRAYGDGYGFGMGLQSPFFVGNFGYVRPSEEIPYFAKFPPVYYSHIVPRPYGVSPYATPPGIVPTEFMVQPLAQPEVIRNPYVDQELVAPADELPSEIAPPKAMLDTPKAEKPSKPAAPQAQRKKKKK